MSQPSQQHTRSPLEIMGNIQAVGEFISFCIATGGLVVGFVMSTGGPGQFLIEVGFFGWMCYAAAGVFLPLALGVLWLLERLTRRRSTKIGVRITEAISVLVGGAIFRAQAYPGVTRDFNDGGGFLMATSGVLILALPFILLWYFKGSTARS